MKSLSEILSSPLYTAAIGAVIGIVAKIIDNRMSDKKGRFVDYLKSAAFCAGLIALWTFITSKTLGGGSSSDSYRAPAPQMRASGSYGYNAPSGGMDRPAAPAGGMGGPIGGGGMPRRMAQPFASQGYQ